jgi:hypothetical protein
VSGATQSEDDDMDEEVGVQHGLLRKVLKEQGLL